MGQGISTDAKLNALVSKLSKFEFKDIEEVFMELSTKTNDGQFVIEQPSWLNRDKFAEMFGLNDLVVEQLFQAFDRDKNGIIDMQEFVTGMALCLHGGIKEKCHLLFKIFNLNEDDGISREELSTVLISCLTSANTLLHSVLKSEGLLTYESQIEDQTGNELMANVVVDKIVNDAFATCDVSNTGKLEIDEFAHWVHKNPKLLNNIFVMQCPKPSKTPNPSVTSEEFSTLELPGSDKEAEKDVFYETRNTEEEITKMPDDSSEQAEEKSNATLLQMSQNVSLSQSTDTSPGNLFKDATNEPNFFDTFGSGNTAPSLGGNDSFAQPTDTLLPRHSSELCLASHTESGDPLQHSVSQGDLNVIPDFKNQLTGDHAIQGTESMQSIELSQESLNDENVKFVESTPPLQLAEATEETLTTNNAGENINTVINASLGQQIITTDNAVTGLGNPSSGINLNTQQQWRPLSYPSVQNENVGVNSGLRDHATSFVNSAMGCGKTDDREAPQVTSDNVFVNNQSSLNQKKQPMVETDQSYEKKRGFSFWQPGKEAMSLLNHVQQGGVLEANHLTTPSVLVENVMGDPVKDMVRKYLGEQEASKRPALTINHVQMNEEGLRKLLAAGCWRAAVDFTTKYLTSHGHGLVNVNVTRTRLTPGILQIWFVRIALLVKLKMFSSAEAELNAFRNFDAPDLYYQYYPDVYPGKKGSIVPFSFRLIHAELPQHNGRPNVALDRLYELLYKVLEVLENLDNGLNEDGMEKIALDEHESTALKELWKLRKVRLNYAIGNCFFTMKEYSLAVELFKECIKLEPERESFINSGIGRMYLQLGDLKSAQKYFNMVEQGAKGKMPNPKLSNVITMNNGYLKLAMSFYAESYQFFSSAMEEDPENFSAHNNAAVCLLFLGKVKEASNILETLVWRSPDRSLQEEILFNISTVYELETSRAVQKKYKLLDLVCQHRGDGFGTQCLKLT